MVAQTEKSLSNSTTAFVSELGTVDEYIEELDRISQKFPQISTFIINNFAGRTFRISNFSSSSEGYKKSIRFALETAQDRPLSVEVAKSFKVDYVSSVSDAINKVMLCLYENPDLETCHFSLNGCEFVVGRNGVHQASNTSTFLSEQAVSKLVTTINAQMRASFLTTDEWINTPEVRFIRTQKDRMRLRGILQEIDLNNPYVNEIIIGTLSQVSDNKELQGIADLLDKDQKHQFPTSGEPINRNLLVQTISDHLPVLNDERRMQGRVDLALLIAKSTTHEQWITFMQTLEMAQAKLNREKTRNKSKIDQYLSEITPIELFQFLRALGFLSTTEEYSQIFGQLLEMDYNDVSQLTPHFLLDQLFFAPHPTTINTKQLLNILTFSLDDESWEAISVYIDSKSLNDKSRKLNDIDRTTSLFELNDAVSHITSNEMVAILKSDFTQINDDDLRELALFMAHGVFDRELADKQLIDQLKVQFGTLTRAEALQRIEENLNDSKNLHHKSSIVLFKLSTLVDDLSWMGIVSYIKQLKEIPTNMVV